VAEQQKDIQYKFIGLDTEEGFTLINPDNIFIIKVDFHKHRNYTVNIFTTPEDYWEAFTGTKEECEEWIINHFLYNSSCEIEYAQ